MKIKTSKSKKQIYVISINLCHRLHNLCERANFQVGLTGRTNYHRTIIPSLLKWVILMRAIPPLEVCARQATVGNAGIMNRNARIIGHLFSQFEHYASIIRHLFAFLSIIRVRFRDFMHSQRSKTATLSCFLLD